MDRQSVSLSPLLILKIKLTMASPLPTQTILLLRFQFILTTITMVLPIWSILNLSTPFTEQPVQESPTPPTVSKPFRLLMVPKL